jgi:tryptophanase
MLKKAGYNLFSIGSKDIYIDLLTDSGTSAQSDRQIAASFLYDCRYAGSNSFTRMKRSIQDIFGFPFVLPCHQGRGAENVFNRAMVKPGQIVLGNYHFDTTRAHIEDKGGIAIDCPIDELYNTQSDHPFKGNLDTKKAEGILKENPGNVAYILLTVTCNSGGGQPVSMSNIHETMMLAREYGVPAFFDGARIFENAYFIKKRCKKYSNLSVRRIAAIMTWFCDGMLMSAKKNGLVHMGGFIGLRNKKMYDKILPHVILCEGFPTYGGMSSRDMEMLAVGLKEWSDEKYLSYYVEEQVGYLGKKLKELGVPLLEPFGGHAIYIDVKRFLPHLTQDQLPGQALACALYLEGGVRSCEIGTVMAGRDPKTGENRPPKLELLRLAVPRLVLTKDHFDYIVSVIEKIWKNRDSIKGMKFANESPILRHFASTFEPIE